MKKQFGFTCIEMVWRQKIIISEIIKHIPMQLVNADYIAVDKIFLMSKTNLYSFGVLTSNVHLLWVNSFCGRLKKL